jgi:deoxyribodipyrimidine photo-lyase
MIEIVWFKRDLRVHDHTPLISAAQTGRPVLPLYVIEPELWAQPDLSARQYGFLGECLDELDAAFSARGAGLVVRVGDMIEVLSELHRTYTISAIHAHEETGLLWTYSRDKRVRAWAKRANVAIVEHRQHGVWRGAHNRSGWAQKWDAMMAIPPVLAPREVKFAQTHSHPRPDANALGLAPDPCPQRQKGGRQNALQELESFLQTRGRHYRKAMSSPHEGALACSRLSPHLAFGTLSMREALHGASKAMIYHQGKGDSAFVASISSFVARLHWHCHFIQKLEDQPDIETTNLHPAYEAIRPIGPDHGVLAQKWITGQTGFPFVDACMRALDATGWLNFRMRAMVVSFSSYHLWQDWRLPAQLLARQFVDFEPGIHFSQVQMQSGTTGINTARIYNPVKQSMDQDPEGAFIRHWVPELAYLPNAFIHEPWLAPTDLLQQRETPTSYPDRIVDHQVAAAFARSQIYQVRTGEGYKNSANAIQNRHGSRKSGLRQIQKRTAKSKKQTPETKQGQFDF